MTEAGEPSQAPELDPQLVADFVEEANEYLPEVAAGFVELEAKPGDGQILHRIFRGIHTIKGNAAFLGFRKIRNLGHKMEDLLGRIREGQVKCSQENIDCLLAGLDELRKTLDRVLSGKSEVAAEREKEYEAILSRLRSACEPLLPSSEVYLRVLGQVDVLGRQIQSGELEPQEALDMLRLRLTREIPEETLDRAKKEEANPRNRLRKALTPAFEGLLDDDKSRHVLDILEELLWSVGEGTGASVVNEALQDYQESVYTVGFTAELRATLLGHLDRLEKLEQGPPPSLAPRASLKPGELVDGQAEANAPALQSVRTMRVEEHKVDEFLDYVGELIITREMLGNVGKQLRSSAGMTRLFTEFQRALEAFTALSHGLQHSIMEVRKLPMKVALQRAPRIVRDLAHELDKRAHLEMAGTQISVDKSLIESFEAPLTHMLRNAVDHGLESPKAREAVGKPAVGVVRVEVSETPDEVLVVIEDDGRGIDPDALREAAVAKKVVSRLEADSLTRDECLRLLFRPGFSTASRVTQVSGRGVGMDVVERNVAELGGHVAIQTELGKGTRFSIHLPKTVTVQIVDGFLVEVAGQQILLPLSSISESFRPAASDVYTVAQSSEFVKRRGRVLPLVRLASLLKIAHERVEASDAIVVNVELSRNQCAGILVDQVLGVQQVVLREVNGVSTEAEIFAGGAVLGDGRVAMIVDVGQLGALLRATAPAHCEGSRQGAEHVA